MILGRMTQGNRTNFFGGRQKQRRRALSGCHRADGSGDRVPRDQPGSCLRAKITSPPGFRRISTGKVAATDASI